MRNVVCAIAGAAALGAFCTAIGIAATQRGANAAAPPGTRPFVEPPVFSVRRAGLLKATVQGAACTPPAERVEGKNVYLALEVGYSTRPTTIYNPATGADDPVHLRVYGDCLSSPTISAEPGQSLHVALHNALPPDKTGCPMNDPTIGCFSVTNFHTHGLHVSPSGNSDNVLRSMPPAAQPYPVQIDIPSDHPAGTFWYHAHQHGSTAMQVTSGMAGVLIVNGHRKYGQPNADIDTILHDTNNVAFPQKLLLFEQISYACFKNANYAAADLLKTPDGKGTWYCPPNAGSGGSGSTPGVVENFKAQVGLSSLWGKSGRFTTINGVVQPTLAATAGKIERWRLVHGGIRDTIELRIVKANASASTLSHLRGTPQNQADAVENACPAGGIPQFEIAVDGLTRRNVEEIRPGTPPGTGGPPVNALQPGYRSDVLVVFPSKGTYCVIDDKAKEIQATVGRRGNVPRTRRLLAIVEVTGDHVVSPTLAYVTDQLVAANGDLPSAVRERLALGEIKPWSPFPQDLHPPSGQPSPCPQPFPSPGPVPETGNFKCVAFALGRPMVMNARAYEHDVVSYRGTVGQTDDYRIVTDVDHIFHIHVNPFQIVDVLGPDPATKQLTSIYAAGKCLPWADQQYCGQRGVYRDSIVVKGGYELVLRTQYEMYDGKFVIHCHILDHEDLGMMANVDLVKPAVAGSH
jgi:FtsP/CotA-like multicopper oxidase with cupredoxin domain